MVAHPLAFDAKLALQMKVCRYAEFLQTTPFNRELLARRQVEARIDPQSQWFLASYPDNLHWVLVLADDAPETANLVPLVVRMAACSARFQLHIVREGFGLDELAAWLDECGVPDLLGDADFPLLLFLDEEWLPQEQWGPFPQAMETYLEAWLERHPEYETLAEDETFDPYAPVSAGTDAQQAYAALLEQLTWEMRVWFNSDLDAACAGEICEVLRALSEGDTDGDAEDDEEDSEVGADGDAGDEDTD